jgi:hypothetical protein
MSEPEVEPRRYRRQQPRRESAHPAVLEGAYGELKTTSNVAPHKPRGWDVEQYGPYPPENVNVYSDCNVYDFIVSAVETHRNMIRQISELTQAAHNKPSTDSITKQVSAPLRAEIATLRAEIAKLNAVGVTIRNFPDAVTQDVSHCAKQYGIKKNDGIFFIAGCMNARVPGCTYCPVHAQIEDLERIATTNASSAEEHAVVEQAPHAVVLEIQPHAAVVEQTPKSDEKRHGKKGKTALSYANAVVTPNDN